MNDNTLKNTYPFKSHYFDLDGLRYHYIDEGKGELVVMLHGNPTWSFYYRNLVKALRHKYRIIAPDHIGCGLSDKPNDNVYSYTLAQRVKDLERLLEHIGTESNITLILHDWGGMIGMCYATQHISAIKRIVILNTGAFHLPAGKNFPWTLKICQNAIIGPLLVRGLNVFSLSALRFCAKQVLGDEERKAYLAPYNSWHNRIAVLRFVQDIPREPDHQSYDLVTKTQNMLNRFDNTPMLICWGGKDFIFDQDFLKEWIRRFPNADVHRFPDAGHYVLEDAGNEIMPLVLKFLDS
ncbi:MAG: alpha/beta fold hydrolase [Candidatus Anammoxibacter sp.]